MANIVAEEWPLEGIPDGTAVEQLAYSAPTRRTVVLVSRPKSEQISRAMYARKSDGEFILIKMPSDVLVVRDFLLTAAHDTALLSMWKVTEDRKAMNWAGIWRLAIHTDALSMLVERLNFGDSRYGTVHRLVNCDVDPGHVIATITLAGDPGRTHYIARVPLTSALTVDVMARWPIGRW